MTGRESCLVYLVAFSHRLQRDRFVMLAGSERSVGRGPADIGRNLAAGGGKRRQVRLLCSFGACGRC
jgi:hypothetical protein